MNIDINLNLKVTEDLKERSKTGDVRTPSEVIALMKEIDAEFINGLVEAYNKRLEQNAKRREVVRPRRKHTGFFCQRGVEYDPAFMSEIEFFRRQGEVWHSPLVNEWGALNWRVMY